MLYNKYRPQKISELVGQPSIANFLLKTTPDNYPHTIIFHGESGVGKTTAARLFLKKMYCMSPTPNGDVCGTCVNCRAIETNPDSVFDYTEMDAASNSSVNDIRELKDRTQFQTFEDKPRIIYIDEAHALSKQAFDALLKITEDASSNIFILATTQLDKIPKTIQTRAIKLEFTAPSTEVLSEFVGLVARKEGRALDADCAKAIAFFSDSSYRESLTVLEKILSGVDNERISLELVSNLGVFSSREEIDAIREFPRLYYAYKYGDILLLLSKLESSEQVYKNFAYYMYNLVKKGYLTGKLNKQEDLLFLSKLSQLLSDPITKVTRAALENIIFEVILNGKR